MYFTSSCQRRCNSVYQITSPPSSSSPLKGDNGILCFGEHRWCLWPQPHSPEFLRERAEPTACLLALCFSCAVNPMNPTITCEYECCTIDWTMAPENIFSHLGSFSFLEFGNSHQVFSRTIYTTARCVRSVQVGVFMVIIPKESALRGRSHLCSVCVRARVHVCCTRPRYVPWPYAYSG